MASASMALHIRRGAASVLVSGGCLCAGRHCATKLPTLGGLPPITFTVGDLLAGKLSALPWKMAQAKWAACLQLHILQASIMCGGVGQGKGSEGQGGPGFALRTRSGSLSRRQANNLPLPPRVPTMHSSAEIWLSDPSAGLPIH